MRMNTRKIVCFVAAMLFAGGTAWAQRGKGLVAQKCATEIEKFCPGKMHVRRAVRTCLEQNRDQLSPECKSALDTTGGGRRSNWPN
jgi:hypothetical protein